MIKGSQLDTTAKMGKSIFLHVTAIKIYRVEAVYLFPIILLKSRFL